MLLYLKMLWLGQTWRIEKVNLKTSWELQCYLLLKLEQLFRLKLHSLVIGSGLTRWYANNHVHSKQPVQLFFSSVLVLRDICFQYPCQLWTHGEGRIKWERIGRMGKMVRRAGNLAQLVAGMFWISSFHFFWISSKNYLDFFLKWDGRGVMGIGGQVTRSGWWPGSPPLPRPTPVSEVTQTKGGGSHPTTNHHQQSHEHPPPADSLLHGSSWQWWPGSNRKNGWC